MSARERGKPWFREPGERLQEAIAAGEAERQRYSDDVARRYGLRPTRGMCFTEHMGGVNVSFNIPGWHGWIGWLE